MAAALKNCSERKSITEFNFEICPYENDYATAINRNSSCVTDLILGLSYTDCLLFFPLYIFTWLSKHSQSKTEEIWTPIMSGLQTKTKKKKNQIQQISKI